MKFLDLNGLTQYNTKILDKVELAKNQILDPDNYGTSSSEDGGVVVVDFRQGYISTSTGQEGDTEGHLITDFISIKNDKFTLYSDAPSDSAIRVFVYDADKNWLSTANEVGYYRVYNGEKASITNNAKYIRCRVSTTATSGTLTVTFDDIVASDHAVHQKIYFNNGYNMESTLIEDDLYQLQVNAEENEFNIFTLAAPKNKASEATLSLMLDDDAKTQFVDLSCMKYKESENGTFSTILQSRGDTPLPSYVLGFNDGKGAGRVRKLEIKPDAIPMQFLSNGIRVRKDNAYDNNWTDDNSVVVNLAELATKVSDLNSSEENTKAYIDTQLASKSDTSHTHNYAGSSSAGGAATNSDKLDGYHADDFMYNCSNYGALFFNSYDLNDWVRSGCYAIQQDCLNGPSGRNGDIWGTILVIKGLDGRVTQIASFWNETDNPLWYRTLNGSNWSLWKKIRDGGNANSANYAKYIQGWEDNRNVNTKPNDYNAKFEVKGLKTNEAIGQPDGSSFSTVAGLRAWHDQTGGNAHELAFTGNGELYQRHGSTDTWGSWNKIYTSQNITYGTSELTPGSSSLTTGNIYLQYE